MSCIWPFMIASSASAMISTTSVFRSEESSTDARENLAQPLADRLFFAGEATSTSVPALVNGAYLTGHHTAKSMAKILK